VDSENSALRRELLSTYAELAHRGLNQGTAGNCSVRCTDGAHFLITPSGMPTRQITSKKIVKVHLNGDVVGKGRPSSEWRFHRDIFMARPEVGAIVHTHSVAATAIACLRSDIPAFHYMVAIAGGMDIRCADYELFGTQAMSDAILRALKGRKACLMANHGLVAIGASLPHALSLAQEVETLAQQYLAAKHAGDPIILSRKQMQAVFTQFQDYGYRKPQ
jgi:L-fuculose-phosphate aldolase